MTAEVRTSFPYKKAARHFRAAFALCKRPYQSASTMALVSIAIMYSSFVGMT